MGRFREFVGGLGIAAWLVVSLIATISSEYELATVSLLWLIFIMLFVNMTRRG